MYFNVVYSEVLWCIKLCTIIFNIEINSEYIIIHLTFAEKLFLFIVALMMFFLIILSPLIDPFWALAGMSSALRAYTGFCCCQKSFLSSRNFKPSLAHAKIWKIFRKSQNWTRRSKIAILIRSPFLVHDLIHIQWSSK